MPADRFPYLTALHAGEEPPLARDQALRRLAETAEYVSQRALQLDEQVQEVEQIVQHLGALARQLRTLSSNTTLEATRMRMNGPLAEIARQMRRISQQISESNDQLGVTLRGYTIATGELRQAATVLLGEARTVPESPDAPPAGAPFTAPPAGASWLPPGTRPASAPPGARQRARVRARDLPALEDDSG